MHTSANLNWQYNPEIGTEPSIRESDSRRSVKRSILKNISKQMNKLKHNFSNILISISTILIHLNKTYVANKRN